MLAMHACSPHVNMDLYYNVHQTEPQLFNQSTYTVIYGVDASVLVHMSTVSAHDMHAFLQSPS